MHPVIKCFSLWPWMLCLNVVIAAGPLRNKPCVQSSTVMSPGRANDGNLLTYSLTGTDLQPYWRADLGGLYTISYIGALMFNGAMASGTEFYISYNDPLVIHDTCIRLCGYTFDGTLSFLSCPGDIPARYVFVNRTANSALAIIEITVVASPTTSSVPSCEEAVVSSLLTMKPALQSSTGIGTANNANDGLLSTYSTTLSGAASAYWQGDLGSLHYVFTIETTLVDDVSFLNVSLYVSSTDPQTCPNITWTLCGTMTSISQTITCPPLFPVRYVIVYTDATPLSIREVHLYGVAALAPARDINLPRLKNTKLQGLVITGSASSPSECSSQCFHNSLCVSFSYTSTLTSDNCVLAGTTTTTTTTQVGWDTYLDDPCVSTTTCV